MNILNSENTKKLVVLVEDDESLNFIFEKCITSTGAEVKNFLSAEEALKFLEEETHRKIHTLITDMHLLGEMTGKELIARSHTLPHMKESTYILSSANDPKHIVNTLQKSIQQKIISLNKSGMINLMKTLKETIR